jgi:hypothetical protein
MKFNSRHLFTAIYTILFLVMFMGEAQAYIDPGSGSLLIQIVIAAICGSLFAIKMFWQRIKGFFYGLFAGKGDKDSKTTGNDGSNN